MRIRIFAILYLAFTLLVIDLQAQQSLVYDNPDESYRLAVELMDRQEYGSAQRLFDKISANVKDRPALLTGSAFGSAFCSYRLQNRDTDDRFEAFLAEYPVSVYSNVSWFYLGNYNFDRNSFSNALKAYDKVQEYELKPEDQAEFYFKIGYCYLQTKEIDQAFENLALAKDVSSPWQSKAQYYYAQIAYDRDEYETAYNEFAGLKSDPDYYGVVPFYLADILYRQEKYEELMESVEPMYMATDEDRRLDLALILGDAAFRTENYTKAQQYLEDYLSMNGRTNRQMSYQLGYIYYKNKQYPKAIEYFEKVTNASDALGQSAFYHIGDCLLAEGEKKEAQKAFYTAYQLDFDAPTREDALFNYAKLTYELSFDPYKEAISAMKEYIRNFPESPRIDEAWQYLVNLSLSSNNYPEALYALERIENKDQKVLAARQKVYYNYGIELFNNKKYKEAAEYFKEATTETYDLKIRAAAYFWLAETHYRQKDYGAAAQMFNRFLWIKEAKKLPEYTLAYYNVAYSWFKLDDFANALTKFTAFVNAGGNGNPQLLNDAHLRMGDCYFALRRYADAAKEYDLIIKTNAFDADYASFQKAICEGVQGNSAEKIIVLRELIAQYPKSTYVDDAIFEIGLTHLITNEQEKGLEYFDRVIQDFPQSSYRSKSLLRKGLIYYNINKPEQSLSALKTVVADYPGTEESKDALLTIKNIYLDDSNVDEYFAYVADIPFANVSMAEQDSLKYIAAENLYLDQRFAEATPAFKEYIESFENGAFMLHASYYLADCEIRADNKEEALKYYAKVIERPKSVFSEKSLVKAANLSFELSDYERALRYFTQLEASAENKAYRITAMTGKMRAYKNLGKNDSTIVAAFELLSTEKVQEDLIEEAHLNIAHAALNSGNKELAMREFRIVAGLTQNINAAEASYYIAEIEFDQGQDSLAMQSAFNLINTYPSYDNWVAKGFLLLADIYKKQDNIFQAKQTLLSIIDHHDGVELVQQAQAKLDELIRLEKEQILKEEMPDSAVQQGEQIEEVYEEEF